MKHKSLHLILFVGMALNGSLAYGQASTPGAINKRARTVEDYKPSTLKEIAVEDAKSDGLSPFRVSVTYTAQVRPISTTSNDALHDWAQCCAGNPDHYKGYVREMQFVENGNAYWLGVQDRLIADFQKEAKVGEAVDLFLIRLSAPVNNGKRGSVLLVESFRRIEDRTTESMDWIRTNLPSYSEKILKVEVPVPCQLKITDSSNSGGVSKAVVFLPLNDLDAMKITVSRRQQNATWDLWLHTTAGKRSVRFMLYQGVPAEAGQASKYSLTFSDHQKAETMAEGFRRAIIICAGATSSPAN
ncbi:MAG: hypothetical protein ND895_28845 [Pyrinomonadaceae bacterium]|nr:hypothetical protein [Pyrinomonadaceae bacterium]